LHLSEEVTSREFEERTRIAEIDLKHDELADAVQAALASVYGDHYSHPQADGAEVPLGPHETVPRWGGIAPNADGRTPQDVIFNYFDYEPEGVSSVGTGMNGVSAYSHTASKRRPPGAYETNGAEAPPMNGAYPYATLPVPAGAHQPYRVAPSPERESGRLLGAAAIGLIGGIAIAATLAVF
jgi:hypothetical protein